MRMWEVRAADGRRDDLLRWLAEALEGRPAQIYRSLDQDAERIVVMLPADARGVGSAEPVDPPDLPDPPAALAARRPGSWIFDRVE
ncbi:MAG: hypothetical protein ACQSGP_17730 [Frankia sp.]